MDPVLLPPPLGVHNGHVPGSQGAPRGSGAPHGPPRRSATLTQMEPVRALTWGGTVRGAKTHPVTVASSARTWWACWGHPSSRWPPKGSPQVTQGWHPVGMLGHRPDVRAPAFGGALRGAKSRPITPDTLGARVVAVLGTLVVAGGRPGGVASGHNLPSTRCARPDVLRCSTCCQDPPSHGQHARRARGGRAQAARKVIATQGGGIQRKAQTEPLVVRAEAIQCAWVTLLGAWGGSVGYQRG